MLSSCAINRRGESVCQTYLVCLQGSVRATCLQNCPVELVVGTQTVMVEQAGEAQTPRQERDQIFVCFRAALSKDENKNKKKRGRLSISK